ncbi:MAG: SusC/RagA family TonB-linked outer membrane protein [Bacteroidota bacterium]
MKRILLLCFVFASFVSTNVVAQKAVSGTVTDESGEGLPGVNVLIKGTTTGTQTDIDGNYRLSVEDGATLRFSYVGFETQEIQIGARTTIDVSLSGATELQEVVVTGYGMEIAANKVTYQTEKIDSEDLMTAQQQVAAAGLAGKIAGMQVNIQNNGVKPQTQVLLRGLTSISQSNEVMYIIDGAIGTAGAFNDLNPQDIQDINVIKGPNASALYGSRAANGAVVITTKMGAGDKFTVGINSNLTFEQVAFMPDFQTEFGIGWDGHYDPIENTNWGPRFDGLERQIGPNFPEGYVLTEQRVPYAPIANNLLDFFETGQTLQNTVYVSGSDENGSYYMSVGRTTTDGIVPDDEFERTTIRLNTTKKLGKVTLGINSSWYTDELSVVGDEIGDQERPLYWFVLNTPANIPLTRYKDWDNPDSYAHADNYYNAFYQNPYWAIGTNRDNDETSRIQGNINGSYDILDNLNLNARVGINQLSGTGREWRDAQEYNGDIQCCHSAVTSFVRESENQFTEINGNVLLQGQFRLNDRFALEPLIGAAFVDTYSRNSTLRANNLSIPGFYDISNGTGELQGTVNETARRTYGIFADVKLGFDEWLWLNLAGRQDFTSTLPTDDNSYFYPSASISAVLTEGISALSNSNFLSFAKITVSNTTTFNDLPEFALNERFFQPARFPFGAINGFEVATTAVDANIAKERLNTTEIGLNLGFFNDRLAFQGAVYRTITEDLITFTTPSVASSANSYLTNIGQLTNQGIELSLSGRVLNYAGITWDASINFTSYRTVVDEINPGDEVDETALITWGGGSYGVFAIEGEEFPQLKAQAYSRDPQGRVIVDGTSGDPVRGDVEAMGNVTPDYIIGGTTRIGWKGISVSATFDYRTGHVYYEQGSDAMEFTGRSVESVSAGREDFVFPNSVIEVTDGDGNVSYVENTSLTVSNGRMGFWQNAYNDIKENYVKDATALKVRELAVNYALPGSILSKLPVSKVIVGFIARNPITILPGENNFSDPEFSNTGSRTAASGNSFGIGGYFTSPPTRSFGFNLNIEF